MSARRPAYSAARIAGTRSACGWGSSSCGRRSSDGSELLLPDVIGLLLWIGDVRAFGAAPKFSLLFAIEMSKRPRRYSWALAVRRSDPEVRALSSWGQTGIYYADK